MDILTDFKGGSLVGAELLADLSPLPRLWPCLAPTAQLTPGGVSSRTSALGAEAGTCGAHSDHSHAVCTSITPSLLLTWMKLLSDMGMCWNKCTHPLCGCPREPQNISGCPGCCPPTASGSYSCLSFIKTIAHPLWNLHLGLNLSPSRMTFKLLLSIMACSPQTQHCVLMPTAAPSGRGRILLQTATHPGAESVGMHAQS